MASIITAHGGNLVNGYLDNSLLNSAKKEAQDLPSWDLDQRQICDIELILNGGFSPLTGFMGKADYDSVCTDLRLADGTVWPMPITLDVTEEFAEKIAEGGSVTLRDAEGVVIAILDCDSKWTADKEFEAKHIFGSTDQLHPAVDYLFNRANPVYLGGRLRGIEEPGHYDYQALRDTPAQLRANFKAKGYIRS